MGLGYIQYTCNFMSYFCFTYIIYIILYSSFMQQFQYHEQMNIEHFNILVYQQIVHCTSIGNVTSQSL